MGSKILALEIALYGKMVTITIWKEQQQPNKQTKKIINKNFKNFVCSKGDWEQIWEKKGSIKRMFFQRIAGINLFVLLNCCNCFGNLVVGWMKTTTKTTTNACMVKGEHDVILFFFGECYYSKKKKKNSKEFKININKNTTKT